MTLPSPIGNNVNMATKTHPKPHLPITEEAFDELVHKLAQATDVDAAAASLTDDELLVFAEVTELMLEQPEASQVREDLARTRVWLEVYNAVTREIESR